MWPWGKPKAAPHPTEEKSYINKLSQTIYIIAESYSIIYQRQLKSRNASRNQATPERRRATWKALFSSLRFHFLPISVISRMNQFLFSTLLFCLMAGSLLAQTSVLSTDQLIERELSTFDLPPFEWDGEPEPLRPRLGIYFNAIPADSVAKVTKKKMNDPWFVIWHVMPHWSADEAGVLIGDTITAINGRAIGDSNYYGEDFVNLVIRDMKPGESARLSIRREGKKLELPVPLLTDERVLMPFTMPERLGRIHQNSWLYQTLKENNLLDWSREIAKQMRGIADIDMSRTRFAGRPNPWRLNVVTALHHNPTRTGAYGRLIVDDLWSGVDVGTGLSGAVVAAGSHLDIPVPTKTPPQHPSTVSGLTEYLLTAGEKIRGAYRPVGSDLFRTTNELLSLLDPNENWEGELDSISDPRRRREARNAYEEKIATLFKNADHVDFEALVEGGSWIAALADTVWLKSFAKQFRPSDMVAPDEIPGVKGSVLYWWETPFGLCVIGGDGPNRYSGHFPFILDVGGDDQYDLSAISPGIFRFVADIDGNDMYISRGVSQGAGVGGVDLLVDISGDDTYRADHFAQGAGLLGVGVLADFSGDDIYASRWCSQGAAFLGVGILYDGGGNDNYSADIYSQAFGYAKGFGALIERSGNDSYRAGWKYEDSRYPNRAHIAMSQGFGFGMRPWSTGIGTDGGLGILTDKAGDDLYASDFFSQGGSYWYAFGVLHDGAGADRYTAGQYSQGSGIHLSFGALLDDAGDDMYDAYHGLEQGNAHDWSAGCLEDLSGNDSYRGSTASQGSALNVSFAWLLDWEGNDRYYVHTDTTSSLGGGNFNRPRKHGSLGMLLDFGTGDDTFTDPTVEKGKIRFRGEKGFLLDE